MAYALGTERAQEGLELYDKALQLNPYMPAWMKWTWGWTQYSARQYEETVETFQETGLSDMDTHLYLALSYAQLGRDEDARREVAKLLRLKPDFTAKAWLEMYHGSAPSWEARSATGPEPCDSQLATERTAPTMLVHTATAPIRCRMDVPSAPKTST
jgi:tetratricopeptide (TPR) repeat protein